MQGSMEMKKYPTGADHYTLYEEIGHGVAASVHRALCLPRHETVAVKILHLERHNCDLNHVVREAQMMQFVDHPNVLKPHCSFVSGHDLWVVMPFMAGGSCLHILRASHPNGLPEPIIATILLEALKGLAYLHGQGHVHRDVKAGNILLDSHGGVKLGDFSDSECLYEAGDRLRARNTFIGTHCWMAPEVMDNQFGYDLKADVWSFGITALELAHGHAPFSRFPPMKVLLMTLQGLPPGLEDRKNDNYTTSFKRLVGACLVKDPSKRPSATELLEHTFFRQARSSDYISRTLLDGLLPLGDRVKDLKRKDEAMIAQEQQPNEGVETMSQKEYIRGISDWCFDNLDIEDELRSDNSQPGSPESPPADYGSNRQNPNQSVFLPITETAANDKNERSDNEEVAKEPVVQQRGRFIVTSGNVDVEKVAPTTPTLERSQSMKVNSAFPQDSQPSAVPSSPASPGNMGSELIWQLNSVLEANLAQRDLLLSIMKVVSASESSGGEGARSSTSNMNLNLLEEATERENELLLRMTNLKLRFPTIPEGSETGQTE